MRGRPRKAQVNDVVSFGNYYGVVVEYRDDVKWDRYHVIRTTDAMGRNPHGPAIWLDSTVITGTGNTSKRPGIVYRHNQRELDRQCTCNCCHHVKGVESEPQE